MRKNGEKYYNWGKENQNGFHWTRKVKTLPSRHPLHPHASVSHPHKNPETDQVGNRKVKFAAHRSKEKGEALTAGNTTSSPNTILFQACSKKRHTAGTGPKATLVVAHQS